MSSFGDPVYVGDMKDGEPHGRGKMIYASGNVYEGEYKDGKRHGRGKKIYHSGNVYECEYKDGEMMRFNYTHNKMKNSPGARVNSRRR